MPFSLLVVACAGAAGPLCAQVEVRACEGLNTAGDEYAPSLLGRGLCYTQLAPANPRADLRSELRYVHLGGNALTRRPEALGAELSGPLHEASARALGRHAVVFSRNRSAERAATNYLYVSREGALGYQTAEELPVNDPRFNCMHPAPDASGRRIIFASDRPGGFGGLDLYYTERTATGWSPIANLGPGVNSAADEAFPFWSPDGALVFASDRPGGLGGHDLYAVDLTQRRWGAPVHLPAPLSSAGNDHGAAYAPLGRHLYFASDRAGGLGGDDLYVATFADAEGLRAALGLGGSDAAHAAAQRRADTHHRLSVRYHGLNWPCAGVAFTPISVDEELPSRPAPARTTCYVDDDGYLTIPRDFDGSYLVEGPGVEPFAVWGSALRTKTKQELPGYLGRELFDVRLDIAADYNVARTLRERLSTLLDAWASDYDVEAFRLRRLTLELGAELRQSTCDKLVDQLTAEVNATLENAGRLTGVIVRSEALSLLDEEGRLRAGQRDFGGGAAVLRVGAQFARLRDDEGAAATAQVGRTAPDALPDGDVDGGRDE